MQVGNEYENKGESITGDEHIANGLTIILSMLDHP